MTQKGSFILNYFLLVYDPIVCPNVLFLTVVVRLLNILDVITIVTCIIFIILFLFIIAVALFSDFVFNLDLGIIVQIAHICVQDQRVKYKKT